MIKIHVRKCQRGEILSKLKSKVLQSHSLSIYDISTLFTTLLHNHIIDNRSEFNIMDPFHYPFDTLFIRFDSTFHKLIVGIPMGTDCAPLVADLNLF